MKEKLIQTVKSIYYKLGFFPPQRILSPEHIVKDLKIAGTNRRKYDIQNHTLKLLQLKAEKEYNQFLKICIPSWDINIAKSQFLQQKGYGIGVSSLPAFRKIKTKNELWFEKVYFSDHPDLQRNIFFYNHIYPLLKEKLQIPKLQKLISGEWLSIVYFDFLKLQKIEKTEELIQEMIAVSLILYQKSKKYQEEISQLSFPAFIQDFTTHFEYQKNKKLAEKELLKYNISFDEIEEEINQSFKVLTHGDIFHTNIFQNKTLIDWDNFGIYPIGFDVAALYYRLLWRNQVDKDFEKWLINNYKNKIDSIHWKVFKRNSFFFLFVFTQKLFKDSDLNNYIIPHIK